jgi:hypothetical protein
MGGLSLNRAKDFGDPKHDQILVFRLANVDLWERATDSLKLCRQILIFAPSRLCVMMLLAKAQRRKVNPGSACLRQPTARPLIKLPWTEVIEIQPKDRDSIAPDEPGN